MVRRRRAIDWAALGLTIARRMGVVPEVASMPRQAMELAEPSLSQRWLKQCWTRSCGRKRARPAGAMGDSKAAGRVGGSGGGFRGRAVLQGKELGRAQVRLAFGT